jgi:hypothetical protein
MLKKFCEFPEKIEFSDAKNATPHRQARLLIVGFVIV